MTEAFPSDVGSDFELPEIEWERPDEGGPAPWVRDGQSLFYLESGRQALSLVEKALRSQGRSRLLLPSHFCESMVEPFSRQGWSVNTLPVNQNLQVDPETITAFPIDGRQDVFLHAPYFGTADSPELLEALESLECAGAAVVVDETHRVLSSTAHGDRVRVASLRKLLPLPDGGYVAGLKPEVAEPVGNRASDIRFEAMRMKTKFLKGAALDREAHLRLFNEAEQLTEMHREPTRMSRRAEGLLARLDYRAMSVRRQLNAQQFVDAFPNSSPYRVVAPAEACVPSHIVVSGPDINGLRRHLIEHRVFCPIHWPRPACLDDRADWRTDLLSIPVDHRYTHTDMLRIAELISSYSSSEGPSATRSERKS